MTYGLSCFMIYSLVSKVKTENYAHQQKVIPDLRVKYYWKKHVLCDRNPCIFVMIPFVIDLKHCITQVLPTASPRNPSNLLAGISAIHSGRFYPIII